jgi:hypothetical protein
MASGRQFRDSLLESKPIFPLQVVRAWPGGYSQTNVYLTPSFRRDDK